MSIPILDDNRPFCINKKAEAIVLITTTLGDEEKVIGKLRQVEALTEAYIVHGPFDIIAKFKLKDHQGLYELLGRKIKKIEGVKGTRNLLIA